MAQAKYSKLGYGNAEDVEAAIALGMLDGRDMIITKDSSEFMYVRDDLSVQKIRPRNRCFASVTEANEQLNETEDTYAGQTVMVKDENGKYSPWIVQQSEATGLFSIEPFYVEPTNFVWQEF